MGMLTNSPVCSFKDRDNLKRPCSGKLHHYDVQMVAELDGTPVKDAPMEKTFICEGHYPDVSDPKFLLCICDLCKKSKAGN